MPWIRTAAAVAMLALTLRAEPQINEVMASNATTLADDTGNYSDWIEIFNPDSAAVNLAGWYLTDSAANKTKWQFPAVSIPAGGYLVVFASNRNHRDPARPLHTNFALSSAGEYLALVKPDGVTVASEFAPALPPQYADISYGVVQTAPGEAPAFGFFRKATPGAPNGGRDAVLLLEMVTMSRPAGPFTQAFDLVLAGAGAGQRIRYVLFPPSPAGAVVPEPTATSPEFTTPIPISSTVVVRAAVFSADGVMHGRVSSAHFVAMGSDIAGFKTRLPVVVLDNHGAGGLVKDDIDHPAWLYAYELAGAPFAGGPALATPATMTVRGNFTSNFLKSSFSLTLKDEQGRDNPQPLFGLDTHEDWALIGPWLTDRSYIRNAFVYALSNRIGRWAPRTRFVEVFVNQNGDGLDQADYYGIGVLTDRLKVGKERINIAPIEPSDNGPTSITGGYVVKVDVVPDPAHYSFITDRGFPTKENTAVVIDTPNAGKLSNAQRDYIRGYVQRMENALYADQALLFGTRTYLDYIDLPSWVDHHILELFVGNVDALYRSEFFTKDRGGKLVSGPVWDFDGSMGNGDARTAAWDTWLTAGNVDPWVYGWFGVLATDTEFRQAWIDRWQSLRRDEFSSESLGRLANALAAEVGPEAAARDAARWIDNRSQYPGGFLGEVAHLKEWITLRAGWIDRQFVPAPAVVVAGDTLTFTPPADAQLAYTLDGSDPRALSGAIAPNATLTSAPLTVPAAANVHVRSYRAGAINAFPGSPWSSAATGANSSPLSPRARLVNLSSRAFVGAADDAMLIAGLSIADTAGRGVLARGVGPTLAAFGAANTLVDPMLRVFSSDGVEIHRNAGWQSSPDVAKLPALTQSVGAFPLPAGSADSALIAALPAGGYTVQVSSLTGQSGVALAEIYSYDENGRIANLSVRARVRPGEGGLIGGFVVRGPAHKRLLIRAVGATLGAFGVSDALADPILRIYSGQTVVVSNDDWSSGAAAIVTAAAARVGAFGLPAGSKDSALLVTLSPGAYTVEVSGKNATEGMALLEIYDVP